MYIAMHYLQNNRISQLFLCGIVFLLFPQETGGDTSTIFTPAGNIGGRSYKDMAEKYIFSFYSIPYATFPSKFSNSSKFVRTADFDSNNRGANNKIPSTRNKKPAIINKYHPTFCMNFYFSQYFRKNEEQNSDDYLRDAIISESCLSLDIFVQGQFLEYSSDLAPVIVIFDDPKADFESFTLNKLPLVIHLTTYTDSLIVRVNYRNGPQGFLYLDEEHFPGNYGMLDQREALMWIWKNIDKFGGDNKKITALGQGLGAVGMGWHLEHSQGLINKLVLLSGSPFNLFASWDIGLLKSLHHSFVSAFDCEKFKSLRYCLEELTDEEIYSVTKINQLPSQLFFVPHHDLESFLERESKKPSSRLSEIDIMVGYQQKDGYVLYEYFFNEDFSFLSLVNLSLPEDLLKVVAFEYSHHHISVKNPTEEDFNAFMSDYFVISSQYKFASMVSRNLQSRVYIFKADIPFGEDQTESEASGNEIESDFLGSNLLHSSAMRQKFTEFIQGNRQKPTSNRPYPSKQSKGFDSNLDHSSGSKTSNIKGNHIWKPINFTGSSQAEYSCQVLELVKSNKTGFAALLEEKTPEQCEPHFSRFWNEVVFQSLEEMIDQRKEKEIDDEYSNDGMNGTVNGTTEGLNETEVPPEEDKEVENSEDPSSQSKYDEDKYESQLKNLQVSLRYEKLRFTVSILGLGITLCMIVVMCILFCYCMGFKKRVKNNRMSRRTSACKGCSSLLRSHRSFKSEVCSTPTTLRRRDSMNRYDVITPLHGFPPSPADDSYQMAKLDRYQAERSTTATPTLLRSGNTYCGPNDCDVVMRQGDDTEVARRLSEHLTGHRISNTFAWLPSPFKPNSSPEPSHTTCSRLDGEGRLSPKMLRPSIPSSESRSTDSSGYGGGPEDAKFNRKHEIGFAESGGFPSTDLTDSLMAGEYKL